MISFKSIFILFFGFLIGIFLFLNGLLINRSEIEDIGQCDPKFGYCQYSPYKRVVILLIDALKYDFIDPNLNQTNFYHGNINVIRTLNAKNKGKYIYLNHFISDPPTTTLQRIKGITTGSLPTFIDMSTNFGSSELKEDNIINQWNKFGFNTKFVGDDTWTKLFPHRFNTSLPYPSFNVKDLDTVDSGVQSIILESLSERTNGTYKKPEILLGHMLGIDHCGHTYGKNHPQMKRKLNELNEFLKKIIALMDKETLVVVFGDHGMTYTGDHGGDSEDELDAALLVISEKPLNFHRQSAKEKSNLKHLSQIDIVPTLAALTGVAIPYSNLGVVRSEMLTSVDRANGYLELNIRQIFQYIRSYESKFGNLHFPTFIREFLDNRYIVNDTEHSIQMLQSIQSHFRSKWAKFNVPLIYSSICGCILHILSLSSYLFNHKTIKSKYKYYYIIYFFLTILQFFFTDSFFFTFIFLCFIFVELVLFFKKLKTDSVKLDNKVQIVPMLISVCYLLVPFSNSFIVTEDTIILYFLQTILFVKGGLCILQYISLRSSPKLKYKFITKTNMHFLKVFGFILLICIGSLSLTFGVNYKICREEQRSWCSFDNLYAPNTPFVLLIIPLLFLIHMLWLRHCGNLASNDSNVLVVKYLLPFSIICLFFHHSIQLVEGSPKFAHIIEVTSLNLPRMAILSSLISLIFLIMSPLLMLHRSKFDNVRRDVPSLFHYLREKQSEACGTVMVHGLATVYSSAVFSCLLATCVLVSVFLKAQFVLGIFSLIIFLFVYSTLAVQLNNIKEDDISSSLPKWEMALVMTLLTQYGFFSTGHQTTISNIPWYSAFIGWSGDHSTQLIPAIMLNINIFSSHILISLFGLLIPLLICSISVSVVNPFMKHTNKKKDDTVMNLGDFYFFKSNDESDNFSYFIKCYYTMYLLYQSTATLGTMVSASYARRHLMAWKIFVPKMMYSVMGLLVVYFATILGYLIIRRIHRLAAEWRSRNA